MVRKVKLDFVVIDLNNINIDNVPESKKTNRL